jgi:hypothetical protein
LLICAFNTARMCRVSTQLTNPGYHFKRIGLEAGPLSQWLFSALAEAGLPVCYRFARHLHFPHDPARVIHDADTCFLD